MDNPAYQPDEGKSKVFAISRYPNGNSNDTLVSINSRSAFLKKPKFFMRLSLVLLVLVIFLLIGLTSVLCLFLQSKFQKICTSSECLRSASNFKYSMDFEADPCDNFYKYTCGHWSDEHPNHGWYPTFSTFGTISERIDIATFNFLTSSDNDDDPLPVKQSRQFYQSCMDTEALNDLGFEVMFKYLEEVGLPKAPSFFTLSDAEKQTFKVDWLKIETNIKKTFAMDVFFGFIVDANIFNRSENVMYIGSIGNGCPLPSPFKKKDKVEEKSDLISNSTGEFQKLKESVQKKVMSYIIKSVLLNATAEKPKEDLLEHATFVVFNISNTIEELATNYSSEDIYTYKSTSIFGLQSKMDDFVSKNLNKNSPNLLQDYLTHMFSDVNVKLDFANDMLFSSPEEEMFLYNVVTYLLDTSDIYIELYLWWTTVFAMIVSTSPEVVQFINKQTESFYVDNTVKSRSLECVDWTNKFMGMAVSYGIANKTFTGSSPLKAESMLHDIKDAFAQGVNHLQWMDGDTKNMALEKCDNMASFIGYPHWLFDKGSLETFYENVTIESNQFLENMMDMVKSAFPAKLESLRTTNSRTFQGDPITVNAYNSFFDNTINVPMAILTFPLYNLGLEVLNYGSMGSVLGHELTHGFDNSGRKHDKYGNFKQWWTNQTNETFETKTQCFIQQYDNFTLDGVEGHVLGNKTLGENIADNGGVNQAYWAYRNYVKKNGHESKLPGFESFSEDQLFFISFGSMWCETASDESLENQLQTDEHAPNEVRVVGTLQNSPQFSKAFNCPAGSNMNPKREKCIIW